MKTAFQWAILLPLIATQLSAQTVSTVAGSGLSGSANGVGTAASFNNPACVTTDLLGNIYVTDYTNDKIRKIDATNTVTNFSGSGVGGSTDGNAATAQFNGPAGIRRDADGNLIIADQINHKIRKVTPTGDVSTLAGSGTVGSTDGTGTAAQFSGLGHLVIDPNTGDIYVSDHQNHIIRKVTSAGVVTTFAGSGVAGSADGTGTAAQFNLPTGIVMDGSGNLIVAEIGTHRLRKITPAGVVTTLAGTGTVGSSNGLGTAAGFNMPSGLAIDMYDNVYIADQLNNCIRKMTPAGEVTTYAGSGLAAGVDGVGTLASFNRPLALDFDPMGDLLVTEVTGHRIRRIDTTCVVSIPDANFKNLLVNNLQINLNGDSEIQCTEAAAADTILCGAANISDMTGLEAFTALTVLECFSNSFSTLDLSACPLLERLVMYNNPMVSSLDLSANTALKVFSCSSNSLSTLDLTANTALTHLYCNFNNIADLDLRNNIALQAVECRDNLLSMLNLRNGNNPLITTQNFINNPSLDCIEVDDVTYAAANWVNKDSWASYSTNCMVSVAAVANTVESRLYPNPATTAIQIETSATILNKTLMDMQGKVWMIVTNGETVLPLASVPAGMYVLQLTTHQGIEHHKIVKE